MDILEVSSIAKINFGLFVIEKRNDGFHNLETIFYPLNKLFDNIVFTKSDSTSIESNIHNIANDSNLIIKAIKLVSQHLNVPLNLKVKLTKNIPMGAGLGGGSSNAAETLKALNTLYALNIDYNTLMKFALELGSDVPYFLNPVPSYATSRGEILTPINFKIDKHMLIVNPGVHVSTKEAYSNIKPKQSQFNLRTLSKKSFNEILELKNSIKNDFEDYVFAKYPIVDSVKKEIYDFGADFSLMSGSGSTLFGIFTDRLKADEANNYFSKKYLSIVC